MLEVKGIYRNGRVELLEPVDLPEPQEVTVTFEPSDVSQDPVAATEAVFGLLSDLSEEEWQLFLEATRRTEPFFGGKRSDGVFSHHEDTKARRFWHEQLAFSKSALHSPSLCLRGFVVKTV